MRAKMWRPRTRQLFTRQVGSSARCRHNVACNETYAFATTLQQWHSTIVAMAQAVRSSGRHACNGRGFAYHQMRMALARLLLALEFELPGDFDAAKFRSGIVNIRTTFLEEPLYVKVTRRHGADFEALANAVA